MIDTREPLPDTRCDPCTIMYRLSPDEEDTNPEEP